MNTEEKSIDDLFDDGIGKALRQLGLIFPSTAEDFERIQNIVEESKMVQPDRLKDPFTFLNRKKFENSQRSKVDEQQLYTQNLAQAAREGKPIPEEVKKQMMEDKHRSIKKNDNT